MADITDQEVINLVNESLRPMAERVRGVLAELEAIGPTVDRILASGVVPNDASVLIDGRASEGITPLMGAHIHGLLAVRTAILALNTTESAALIELASVRPLRIVQ